MMIFQAYLQKLTRREQIMVCVMGVCLVITFVYLTVIYPVSQTLIEQSSSLSAAEQKYDRMVSMLKTYQATPANQGAGKVTSGRQDLRTVILQQADQAQISISRLRSEPNGALSVWLDQVDSKDYFKWMAILERQHGIQSEKITIEKIIPKKAVRVQMLLTQGKR